MSEQLAGPNLIAALREIRSTLRDAVRSGNELEAKFSGPRPSDSPKNPSSVQDSVGTIVGEITNLSSVVLKQLCRQHEIVGDFANGVESAPARYA